MQTYEERLAALERKIKSAGLFKEGMPQVCATEGNQGVAAQRVGKRHMSYQSEWKVGLNDAKS